MKTPTQFILAGSLALAPVLLVVAQQFFSGRLDKAGFPIIPQHPVGRPMGSLVVNRETWDVVDLLDPSADLTAYNTDEMRWARYKATLALEFPDEYAKQYPPTAEELALREEGRRIIMNPPTLEETRASLGAEEQKAFDASIHAFLSPVPVAETNE